MRIVKIVDNKKDLSNDILSTSEMTKSEQSFLIELIKKYKPIKLLELGVASGSSSALILNAIQQNDKAHLFSVDYSIQYYREKEKKTGFIVDEYPELKNKWTLYTGGLASDFLEKIGEGIDFCFIDTMHSLPGELIDFILVLPYLKPNAIVVVHDTNLQTWGNWPECTSNNMLVSAISGEKLVPETFESIFYHNTLKTDFRMYFPNITGIVLDASQKDKIWDIFNLLTQKWKYIPSTKDIISIRSLLKKHYSEFYVNLFEQILNYQIDIAKADKTIKDIIQEYRTSIENKIESQNNTIQDMFLEHRFYQENLIENFSKQQKNILINIQDNQNILKTFLEYSFLKKIYYKYKIFRFFYYFYNREKYKKNYSKIKIMYKNAKNELNKKLLNKCI